MGLSLLFIMGALILLFDLVQPEYANFQMLKGQLAGEQALFATETQAVSNAQNLISQYKGQSGNAQTASLAVPAGEDLAGALAQVYGLAANSSIAIQSVGISAPDLQAAANSQGAQLVQPLGTVTFQIAAAGTYEALKNFLQGLETNVRIFDVKGLSITPISSNTATPGKSQGSQDFFTYDISATAYYQEQTNASTTP